MNILILGSGGREHAFAWKLKQSPLLSRLFVAPGNAGTAEIAENISIAVTDFEKIAAFCLQENIKLVIVGPEDPLVLGIHDYFLADGRLQEIGVIGPVKAGARLEGSKEFAKLFMQKYDIPTAAYLSINQANKEDGFVFLDSLNAPYVLKADGLAAGKGVIITSDLEEAKANLKEMLDGKFGAASNVVVIEEFMQGIELSVFVLTDGESYVILPEAKDYKRIGEGDTGLNTGGMGAVSPVPFADAEFMQKVEQQIVIPTIQGLKQEGISYQGFIFIGLMNMDGNPKVVEYNVRMGDPETEVVIPRIKSDFLALLQAVANRNLGSLSMEISPEICTTVMLVSGGYPEAYEKGFVLSGTGKVNDSILFHAGTSLKDGQVLTSGGRVMAVTSLADSRKIALEKSFKNASLINFDKKYYRRDIGADLEVYP